MLKIIEIHVAKEAEISGYSIGAFRDDKIIMGFDAYDLWETPEDASLDRGMSFAYDAIEFFRLGYEAGKNGEEVVFESKQEDD